MSHHTHSEMPAFSNELEAQATTLAASTSWLEEPDRQDLRGLLCVCVDDASTQDADDALSCEPRLDGGWNVGVHICDPDALVPKDSPLDHEAMQRATSVYLPLGTTPMFPTILSEGALSLLPDKLRPALTMMFSVAADLEVEGVEIFPSIVCVDHHFTYAQVDSMLERDPYMPQEQMMHTLSFLADELFAARLDQGAVSLPIPEPRVQLVGDLAHDPEVVITYADPSSLAYTLVSELMILASGHAGRFCAEHEIPVIYRTQPPPSEPLFGSQFHDLPEGLAQAFFMRGKMSPGSPSVEPAPHFALGLQEYAQATSPIRRFTDLICQRQIKAHLRGEPLPYSTDDLEEIASGLEASFRAARLAERGARRHWTLVYLSKNKGKSLAAHVVQKRTQEMALLWIWEVAMSVSSRVKRSVSVGEDVMVTVERADASLDQLSVKVQR